MAMLSTNLSGFIPTSVSENIVQGIAEGSAILRMVPVEPMETLEKTVPVLAQGAGAYFVAEGTKITAEDAEWLFPKLQAKKLAIIIPMSREALDRQSVDVFEELKKSIADEFAKAFDKASIFGTNSPYASNIVGAATTAGNVFTFGSVANATYVEDVSDLMALVESDGYDVNGFIGANVVRSKLRKESLNGNIVYEAENGDNPARIYGIGAEFITGFPNTAELVAGNFNFARAGILNDIRYEVLKEATLDGVGNLAELDLVALKATMHIAFLVVKQDAFAVGKPKTT